MAGEHSIGCESKRASASAARYTFAMTWPKACWHCEATGATGVPLANECEICVGQGLCPRCGRDALITYAGPTPSADELECGECSWSNLDVTTQMPPYDLCVCDIEGLIS